MVQKIKKRLNTQERRKTLMSRFRKDEDGSLILFSLFMFVLILWFGGMAVDLMRYETTRAKLQGTLDRATLASADLDQILPPEQVCEDYFAKAGMSEFLESCVATEGINFRVVTANAEVKMPLFFYDLPTVFSSPFSAEMSTLTVSGSSTAEERVTDVEISLVLDVSGSMGRNSRIQNLRPAAREFVSAVLANNTNAPNGLITISMIPYSAVVNPGTDIEPFLNLNRAHMHSACPLFPDNSLFNTTELDLDDTYDHVAHFDPDWYYQDGEPIGNPWCHVGDHNAIVAATTNESALHDAINDLEPYGNTAIDMGVKWGVALLDPSTQTIISGLAGQSGTNVPAIANGRPQDHGQSDVLKVVVVMTDGSNTSQYDLQPRFKYGQSFVWFNLANATQQLQTVNRSNISVQYSGLQTPNNYYDDRFYVSSNSNRWRDHPDGFSSNAEYRAAMLGGTTYPSDPGVGPTYDPYGKAVRHASWQELFSVWEHNDVNNSVLSRAYSHRAIGWSAGTTNVFNAITNLWETIYYPDYGDADYAINYGVVNSTQANARLSDICAAARNEGIIIYTVAFEAPSGGQAALQDCASSSSHYFDVAGTDISSAFSAIASDIRALKLTQ